MQQGRKRHCSTSRHNSIEKISISQTVTYFQESRIMFPSWFMHGFCPFVNRAHSLVKVFWNTCVERSVSFLLLGYGGCFLIAVLFVIFCTMRCDCSTVMTLCCSQETAQSSALRADVCLPSNGSQKPGGFICLASLWFTRAHGKITAPCLIGQELGCRWNGKMGHHKASRWSKFVMDRFASICGER